MTEYLLLSHGHGLAPIAWRLRDEQQTVHLLNWLPSYDAAWEGTLDRPLTGDERKDQAAVGEWVERAKKGELTVVLDSGKWLERFQGAAQLYSTFQTPGTYRQPLRLGSWWDGTQHSGRHLVVEDIGVFPGGLGARGTGGLTVVRADRWPEPFEKLLEEATPALEERGFRGPVEVLTEGDPSGSFKLTGVRGGWFGFHGLALVAGLGGPLHGAFEGGGVELAHRFTVLVPVSMAPWPKRGGREVECPSCHRGFMAGHRIKGRVRGLTPQQQDQMFWHDVRVEDGELVVAGADGLVGVARGTADSLDLARRKALAVAGAVEVPDKQVRADAGAGVDEILSTLELAGFGVL